MKSKAYYLKWSINYIDFQTDMSDQKLKDIRNERDDTITESTGQMGLL